MKKLLFFVCFFFFSLLFPQISKAEDLTNVHNIVGGIKDSTGVEFPALNIGQQCYSVYSTWIKGCMVSHDENNYNFIIINDSERIGHTHYTLFLFADYVYQDNRYATYKYFANFKFQDNLKPYISSTSASSSSSSQIVLVSTFQYTQSSSSELDALGSTSYCNYGVNCGGKSDYRTSLTHSLIQFTFDPTISNSWELLAQGNGNIDLSYHNSTTNYDSSIFYSTFDIYNNVSQEAIYHESDRSKLPDYLTGYKEVIIDENSKYVFLSNISSGSIYIPKQSFNLYGGKLSYYDRDIKNQPYSSIIQDYKITDDELYIKQNFDLSSYVGADFVLFNKYLYIEDDEDISYSIYVPENAYTSIFEPVPNSENGNDFNYKYQDENGVIHDETYSNTSSDVWAVGRGIEILKNKLGFIAYPFTLIIDVLKRYTTISEGNGIIHIPDIKDPVYGHILINAQDFNLTNIFNYGVIGTIYNIYLYLVDVIIIIGLVNLAKNKFDETIGEGKK